MEFNTQTHWTEYIRQAELQHRSEICGPVLCYKGKSVLFWFERSKDNSIFYSDDVIVYDILNKQKRGIKHASSFKLYVYQ